MTKKTIKIEVVKSEVWHTVPLGESSKEQEALKKYAPICQNLYFGRIVNHKIRTQRFIDMTLCRAIEMKESIESKAKESEVDWYLWVPSDDFIQRASDYVQEEIKENFIIKNSNEIEDELSRLLNISANKKAGWLNKLALRIFLKRH